MVPSKCISKKGEKECVVRSSGSGKKHLTVVLLATADGKMLPPMIIFKGKTEKTIRDLNIQPGFIVKTQKKAWMDDDLMKIWIEEMWLKHINAECKKLGFESSLLSFDAFAARVTEGVKAQLLESKSDILPIPAGCTSKCQPMDVCLNKPFKAVLRRCWVKYVASVVESFPDANSDSSFKLPVPTRQNMIDWVKEGHDSLVPDQELVKKSFEVCGISSTDTGKVRNGDFFKQCMEKALQNLEADEGNDIDENPFELCDQ